MTGRALVAPGLCVLLGSAAGAILVGGWLGPALGVALGLAGAWWLRRQPTPAQRRELDAVRADLPFAADLLAAVLRAGAAPDAAARLVAAAIGGSVGARLSLVDRALRLGASSVEAWGYLGDARDARRITAAAERSAHSGAAFAAALARVADDLRVERLLAVETAARRAGVLIVLPLGLCFLPAFVLTGLVPVIVAVIGGVLLP
jgi:pilus assembly protein TadC